MVHAETRRRGGREERRRTVIILPSPRPPRLRVRPNPDGSRGDAETRRKRGKAADGHHTPLSAPSAAPRETESGWFTRRRGDAEEERKGGGRSSYSPLRA